MFKGDAQGEFFFYILRVECAWNALPEVVEENIILVFR